MVKIYKNFLSKEIELAKLHIYIYIYIYIYIFYILYISKFNLKLLIKCVFIIVNNCLSCFTSHMGKKYLGSLYTLQDPCNYISQFVSTFGNIIWKTRAKIG